MAYNTEKSAMLKDTKIKYMPIDEDDLSTATDVEELDADTKINEETCQSAVDDQTDSEKFEAISDVENEESNEAENENYIAVFNQLGYCHVSTKESGDSNVSTTDHNLVNFESAADYMDDDVVTDYEEFDGVMDYESDTSGKDVMFIESDVDSVTTVKEKLKFKPNFLSRSRSETIHECVPNVRISECVSRSQEEDHDDSLLNMHEALTDLEDFSDAESAAGGSKRPSLTVESSHLPFHRLSVGSAELNVYSLDAGDSDINNEQSESDHSHQAVRDVSSEIEPDQVPDDDEQVSEVSDIPATDEEDLSAEEDAIIKNSNPHCKYKDLAKIKEWTETGDTGYVKRVVKKTTYTTSSIDGKELTPEQQEELMKNQQSSMASDGSGATRVVTRTRTVIDEDGNPKTITETITVSGDAELEDNMKNIVDQFMTEEVYGQDQQKLDKQ